MYTSTDWYRTTSPSSYTVSYTTCTGRTVYETYEYPLPVKKRRQEPELDVGDTTALDEFLGGFLSCE